MSEVFPNLADADARVRKVELVISTLLRTGVVTSVAVILAGLAISFVHHPDYLYNPAEMQRLTRPGAAFPHTLADVAAGCAALRGQAIIAVGLLVLLITPVLRVAVSIFAFIYQRDGLFTLITSIVLVLLLFSFALGRVE
jgi:uncharacterized membrane protein